MEVNQQETGRRCGTSALDDVIKIILVVCHVHIRKNWRSWTSDHHDFACVIVSV